MTEEQVLRDFLRWGAKQDKFEYGRIAWLISRYLERNK